ncbi:hypothetical protein [Ralstonia sp. 1B3]|uniref:hypothetical protein n=1 Tax=Ralstonia sp. 1B3 TaxID=2997421 RepID=UPI002FC89D8F
MRPLISSMAGMAVSSGAPCGVGLIENNRVIKAFWMPVASAAIGKLRSAVRVWVRPRCRNYEVPWQFWRGIGKTAEQACMRVRSNGARYNNTRGRA